MSIYLLLLLCVITFVAGFLDSIAGGGGLLTVPAYLLAGLSPQYTLGTNKFVHTAGTGTAVFNFVKNKKFILKVILCGIVFSIMGSIIGTRSILFFNQVIVGKIITLLLPFGLIAILIPKKESTTKESLSKTDLFVKTPIICLVLGFYDGFFGPGTGSLLAIAFYFILKMDLVKTTGSVKIFNLASNFGSVITFIIAGKIMYSIVLPLMASSMFGNYLGSHFAIKKGTNFIKFFLAVAITLVIISLTIKYFF